MASVVDLCNLSLARLGDEANVVSIEPPDGSAQAAHCARFLPMVRDSLLQAHAWGFALRREALAAITMPAGVSGWLFAYALPNQCLQLLAVQAADAPDDFTASITDADDALRSSAAQWPHLVELTPAGAMVILTDTGSAIARFVQRVDDPTLWSPLFTETLSWRLAAAVAGPLLKGGAGMQQARRCEEMAAAVLARARAQDAQQSRPRILSQPLASSWLSARR